MASKLQKKSGEYVLVRQKQMKQLIVYDECSFTYTSASYSFIVHHLVISTVRSGTKETTAEVFQDFYYCFLLPTT